MTTKKTDKPTRTLHQNTVIADWYHGAQGTMWSVDIRIGDGGQWPLVSYGGPGARRRALAHAKRLRAALEEVTPLAIKK